ncbi:MAG: hypothetical protein M3R55_01905 [Acidobacteriota bacterium]|nr:hypothetical protein [Acidobacteriota bacterium]
MPTSPYARPPRTACCASRGGGSVEALFISRGIAKSQVAVGHTKLASAAADRMKRWWTRRLAALDSFLAAPAPARTRAAQRVATTRLAAKRLATKRPVTNRAGKARLTKKRKTA